MSARTTLTLVNGREIDLRDPRAEDIDFDVIAEHLAKEKRYNGATPGVEYSVAQHCVIGVNAVAVADAEELAGLDRELAAAYVLLHDGHEAFLRDDTTPKKNALAEIAHDEFGVLAGNIIGTFDRLTEQFDVAIHEAAGLPWPMTEQMRAFVKRIDLQLFVTEWRDLMGARKHPDWGRYRDVKPLPVSIVPVDWKTSRSQFAFWCHKLLPAMQGKA